MGEQMKGRLDGWMNGKIDEGTGRWLDGWMEGKMDVQLDEGMDGGMDGRVYGGIGVWINGG